MIDITGQSTSTNSSWRWPRWPRLWSSILNAHLYLPSSWPWSFLSKRILSIFPWHFRMCSLRWRFSSFRKIFQSFWLSYFLISCIFSKLSSILLYWKFKADSRGSFLQCPVHWRIRFLKRVAILIWAQLKQVSFWKVLLSATCQHEECLNVPITSSAPPSE